MLSDWLSEDVYSDADIHQMAIELWMSLEKFEKNIADEEKGYHIIMRRA